MNIGNLSFQPKVVTSLIAFVVLLVLLALGNWQLNRADEKQALFDQYQQRGKLPPIDMNSSVTKEPAGVLWRRAVVKGAYHKQVLILLDNQIYGGRVGYYVFTPLKINGFGDWVLVNRGWVPAGEYRDRLPDIETPDSTVSLTGTVKQPPFSGIVLNDNYIEKMGSGILRTQTIDLHRLEKETGIEFLPYILRLDPKSATGFVRDWTVAGSGKEKNLGYAFQWFMMAAVLLLIYLYLTIKRSES